MDSREPACAFRLMLITDRRVSLLPLVDTVAVAVGGGATAVQVREPDLGTRELLALVRDLVDPVREGGALLLVNDRVDVALAAGADGVHLKRVSLPVKKARELMGPDRWVGVSTHHEAEIDRAFAQGADYVAFGPVFETPSKAGVLDPRGPDLYERVARAATGPVLALGGVSTESLPRFRRAPAGIAVIRAIMSSADPEASARELRRMLDERGRP